MVKKVFKLFDKSCFQKAHAMPLTFSLSLPSSKNSPDYKAYS